MQEGSRGEDQRCCIPQQLSPLKGALGHWNESYGRADKENSALCTHLSITQTAAGATDKSLHFQTSVAGMRRNVACLRVPGDKNSPDKNLSPYH